MHIARALIVTASIVLVSLMASLAHAQVTWSEVAQGDDIEITLSNGDVFRGSFIRQEDGQAYITHPIVGEIGIPITSVDSIARVPEGDAELQAGEGEGDAEAAEEPTEEEEIPEEPVSKWEHSLEVGIDGSEGNTVDFNARLRFGSSFTNDKIEFNAYALYLYSEENRESTKNRAEVGVRNDWLISDSPWRVFAQGLYEYDEEKSFDSRISGNAGLGYTFVDTEKVTFIGRLGLGTSREWGTNRDRFVPEGIAAIDLRYKIDDRQSFTGLTEYIPNLEDFNDYRVRAVAAYQLQMDLKGNLFLRLGLESRYDETVDPGDDRNDLDYFVTISYQF